MHIHVQLYTVVGLLTQHIIFEGYIYEASTLLCVYMYKNVVSKWVRLEEALVAGVLEYCTYIFYGGMYCIHACTIIITRSWLHLITISEQKQILFCFPPLPVSIVAFIAGQHYLCVVCVLCCLWHMQVACPDVIETIKGADILIFVVPHQVTNHSLRLALCV